MHLELTGILVCPDCEGENGLVAFVDRMQERRIVEGRLDCPVCERRHVVRDGVARLGGDGERPDAVRATPSRRTSPDLAGIEEPAIVAAALLGPAEGPEILLLTGGAEVLAPAVARLRPEAVIVTWGAKPPEPHPHVHPVVPASTDWSLRLPFRVGSFAGAVTAGTGVDAGAGREALARVLAPGGRLVVLAPSNEPRHPAGELFHEIASDARAWVGKRT